MRHAFTSPAMRRQLNTALYVKHTKPDASAPQGTPAAMAIFRRMDKAFMKLTRPPRWGVVHLTFGSRPGRFVPLRVKLTKGARPRVRRRALARMVAKTK